MDGKPYLKNLEVFGRAVLEDLWTAVEQQFVEVIFSNFRKSCSIVKLFTITRNCMFYQICKKKKKSKTKGLKQTYSYLGGRRGLSRVKHE